MERTYYTLDDIRKAIKLSPDMKGPYAMNNETLGGFIRACLFAAEFATPAAIIEPSQAFTCFRQYIWPRFYQEAIIYTDSDETEDLVEKFCRTKAGQIYAWWLSSSQKYNLLIQNLENNKSKLLDDVKSSSIARFNDTPQNSGDFSDDPHTSNITTTENSSNAGTMMQRLNEIEDRIKQLYLDWSDEFRKFIIWSAN